MSGVSLFSSLLAVIVLALCLSLVGVGSVWVEDDLLEEAANCTDFTSCRECAAQKGCGWCPATAACLEGTSHNESTNGLCNVTHGGWHINDTQCRNCSAFTNCKSCVEAYTNTSGGSVCGWCDTSAQAKNGTKTNGTCWEGTAAGPFYKSPTNATCSNKTWGLSSGFCGDDDSDKRKLAIIIGLSVAGGLFVLAVAATIVFVIVKRAQRSRGYQAINESV